MKICLFGATNYKKNVGNLNKPITETHIEQVLYI